MLRKEDIDHILRAAASVTNHNQFVMVGTGAVIAVARHIPVSMMLTSEIDIYVEGPDSEAISDQIDGALGNGSMFHRSFRYYGDGVGPKTAMMPVDWKMRTTIYTIPDGTVSAICPSPNDVAIAKLCAAREKDRDWIQEALRSRLVKADVMRELIQHGLPAEAPSIDVLLGLLANLTPT